MTRKPPSASAKPTARPGRQTVARGPVLLVAGLGNPGAQYAGNRHNVGFMALDRVAADHGFAPWQARFQGHIAEGRVSGTRVILLKPGTFMNESGRAVGEAARFHKIPPQDVIVLHDELDLAPGKLRVKQGGGHAGHNGLRSIHAHIGTDYARVRIGIGHPGDKSRVSGYVLHDFAKAELPLFEKVLDGVSDGFPDLIGGDEAGFQNTVARHTTPQRTSAPPHQARAAAKSPAAAAKKAQGTLSNSPDNPLARLLARFSR